MVLRWSNWSPLNGRQFPTGTGQHQNQSTQSGPISPHGLCCDHTGECSDQDDPS